MKERVFTRARLSAVFTTGAVLLGSITLDACSTATTSPPAARAAPAPRALTATESGIEYQAEQLLTRDCMAEHGFRYWPMPQVPVSGYRTFDYVVDDVAWAREHGFGRQLNQRLDSQSTTSPGAIYAHSLSPARLQAFGAALSGPTATGLTVDSPLGGTLSHSAIGCTADVWRHLYGDAQAWFAASETVNNLAPIREGMVTDSADYKAGAHTWSACMSRRGHQASTPQELEGRRLTAHEPNAEQLDVAAALAEAECAQSTGLAALASHLDQHYAGVLYQQHKQAFDEMRRLQLAALPTAWAIVAKG